MLKNLRSKKGFTLLELIVVVVVLGILAALAIPSFSTVKQSAANKVAYSSAESIVRNAQAQAAFEGVSLSDVYLDIAGSEITGYNADLNTLTISSGGKTAVATIDATTGGITVAGASASVAPVDGLVEFKGLISTWYSTYNEYATDMGWTSVEQVGSYSGNDGSLGFTFAMQSSWSAEYPVAYRDSSKRQGLAFTYVSVEHANQFLALKPAQITSWSDSEWTYTANVIDRGDMKQIQEVDLEIASGNTYPYTYSFIKLTGPLFAVGTTSVPLN